ncbi:hypothetical protein B0H14DRAFT_1072474 [Mycena olivaceomarginata]|nr:hypothetical protein B0H14DRAFT_1072474 [Mycena olivaceomarginata]
MLNELNESSTVSTGRGNSWLDVFRARDGTESSQSYSLEDLNVLRDRSTLMNCTSIEILPDDVLGTILVLVADFPAPANAWDTWNKYSEPFPIAAGRVSRRWRTMTLSYPELWTTIRISRHSFTRKLAALFVKRSGSYPLDISINLECYIYKNGRPFVPAFLSLSRVLAIIGPHVGRWRTIALRGWDQLQELATFLRNSPVPASRLEYAHLSTP